MNAVMDIRAIADRRRADGMERLRELYAMLAGIPRHAIDIDSWRYSQDTDMVRDAMLVSVGKWAQTRPQHYCGTTACAVGWACAYPPFKAKGLRFDARSEVPKFRGLEHWDAVATFFGIQVFEAKALFTDEPDGDHLRDAEDCPFTDKRQILMRIRNFLLKEGVITAERVEELKVFESTLDQPQASV